MFKNICTSQTSLHPTIFVSSSFLFIVKDDAARDLIFSDPYINKHSKVHCICKYLSLAPKQWSLCMSITFLSLFVSQGLALHSLSVCRLCLSFVTAISFVSVFVIVCAFCFTFSLLFSFCLSLSRRWQ